MRKRALAMALAALMVMGGISGSHTKVFAGELPEMEAADPIAVEESSEALSEVAAEAESTEENSTIIIEMEDLAEEDAVMEELSGEDVFSEDEAEEDVVLEALSGEDVFSEDEANEDVVTSDAGMEDAVRVEATEAIDDAEYDVLPVEDETISEDALYSMEVRPVSASSLTSYNNNTTYTLESGKHYILTLNQDLNLLSISGSEAALTIKGSGKLTVGANSTGGTLIHVKDLTIESGTVIAKHKTTGLQDGEKREAVLIENDFTMSGGSLEAVSAGYGIYGVEVAGNAQITGGSINTTGYIGFKSANNLTITGGTVTGTGTRGAGISTQNNITVSGGTITATSPQLNAFGCYNIFTITGDAKVTASGGGGGIGTSGRDSTVIISGGEVHVTSTSDQHAAIFSRVKDVIISGGTVTAVATNAKAVDAGGNVQISGGTLTAKTTAENNAIYAEQNVTISGGTVTAETPKYAAIYAEQNVTIEGGANVTGKGGFGISTGSGGSMIIGGTANVTATGSNGNGLYAGTNLTVNGGTINATGTDGHGLKAEANLGVNSGTVNATGYNGNGLNAGQTLA